MKTAVLIQIDQRYISDYDTANFYILIMPSRDAKSVAVLLHLLSLDHWSDFVTALENVAAPFDLLVNLVNTDDGSQRIVEQTRAIHAVFPDCQILVSDNRGMDVGGMFRLFQAALDGNYSAMLYAHSKSNHQWRRLMLEILTSQSKRAIDALTEIEPKTPRASQSRDIGMVGTYFYPFDYFNLHPFLQILAQTGIAVETEWERYFAAYPAARQLSIGQRIQHARDMAKPELRPEVDLDYYRDLFGDAIHSNQPMEQNYLERFRKDGVLGPLPYFPGNFFWIARNAVERLNTSVNFEDEFNSLPMNLESDISFQSRAHAWERALPAFVLKSGFDLMALSENAARLNPVCHREFPESMQEELVKAAVLPFAIVEAMQINCGYERSFKFSDQNILANRYLLGISPRDVTRQQVLDACYQMSMPESLLVEFNTGFDSANVVFLAFEANEKGGATYKVYLEYLNDLETRLAANPGFKDRYLLGKGFKWQYDNPKNHVVTNYECLPGLDTAEIHHQIDQQFAVGAKPECLPIVHQIVDKASAKTRRGGCLFIEVREPGNHRTSFDLNLYSAGMTISDIQPSILRAAQKLDVPGGKFNRLMQLTSDKALGHISCGFGRDGFEHFSIYYEM